MRKTLTRLLCTLLLAIMVLSVFTACGKEANKETDGDVIDVQTNENPNIPGKDYGGHEFKILTKEGTAYNTRYIVADAETGEVLGDAITKRNSALEQKYNIKINQMKVDDVVARVRSSVMSGTIEFDAIYAGNNSLATMAVEGLLYDLNTVERFDFTKSYWDSNACEQLEMGGKLYFTNNSTNIHSLGWAMFFNKYLVEEYGLTSPYEHMANNTWTIDTWAEMVKSCNKDLDGDGQMTVADRYGLLVDHALGTKLSYASGIRATTNDESGKPVLTLMNDKTKLETIYNKLAPVLSDSEYVCCTECDHKEAHGFAHKWAYARYLFTQDYYLFTCQDAEDVHEFAQMEHEFGIVPLPKYDENQEGYRTQYPALNNLFALPALVVDQERTFNIIEDMNYYSSFIVYPTWFDVILTRRYARDDESEASLKILQDNRVYDIGMSFDFGGIRTSIMGMDIAKNANIIRNYERYKKQVQTSIDNTYQKYLETQSK